MANGIDLYQSEGGDVAPYSPSPLQPIQPDSWGELSPREIDSYQGQQSQGNQIFGQTLPAGVSINQVQAWFSELSTVFQSDFSILKHNQQHIQEASSWFMNALTNPPAQQRQRHRFNLFEHSQDLIFQAFANFAHDNHFSAKFVQDACWWVSEVGKKLNALNPTEGAVTLPRTATPASADPLDSLNDAQYNWVIKHNEQVKAQTKATLQDRWGKHTFQQNLDLAQKYLESLPAREQAHFDQFTGNWVHMYNTVEFSEFCYNAAIGAGSLPTSGAEIARELASIENVMKTERRAYNNDIRLQARYRTLLDMRGN